jgi:hypothetical protein
MEEEKLFGRVQHIGAKNKSTCTYFGHDQLLLIFGQPGLNAEHNCYIMNKFNVGGSGVTFLVMKSR